MFGLAELDLQLPQSIPLVTRCGNPISNNQGGQVSPGRAKAFRDMCQKSNWEFRCGPEGLYNCAGHVWASRRTGISQTADWRRILTDDGYRRVSETSLRPDDLVLYRDLDADTYLHIARIVRLEIGVSSSSPPIPIVLSKWGHDLGECCHRAYQHGLDAEYNVGIEFWTDRSNDDTNPATTRSLII
jgi:hypothetical protein